MTSPPILSRPYMVYNSTFLALSLPWLQTLTLQHHFRHPLRWTVQQRNINQSSLKFSATNNSYTLELNKISDSSGKPRHLRPKSNNHKKAVHCTVTDKPSQTWKIQKAALENKFGDQGWIPRKRLSPDALDGVRELHAQDPIAYSTPVLAQKFQLSPEAIRRILKSKWVPSEVEKSNRRRRWERRGEAIWSRMAELGVKSPRKWRNKHTSVSDHSLAHIDSNTTSFMQYHSQNAHVRIEASISDRIL